MFFFICSVGIVVVVVGGVFELVYKGVKVCILKIYILCIYLCVGKLKSCVRVLCLFFSK